eukprot:7230887-Pyramimonas_sp.AAC.1
MPPYLDAVRERAQALAADAANTGGVRWVRGVCAAHACAHDAAAAAVPLQVPPRTLFNSARRGRCRIDR